MQLEGIKRRNFSDSDCADVEARVAGRVEADPELFLRRYLADARSFAGRYVNSDLMKETFDEYNWSIEARSRYNVAVHNSAAVLAAEQYRRAVSNDSVPSRDAAVFLTGIPGAGKTTYAIRGGELPRDVRVLYEGQLSNAGPALPKIALALAAGLRTEIVVIHVAAAQALRNTIHRFKTEGRGASIEAMASIQGGLPASLSFIHERFGDAVDLRIVDRRDTMGTALCGWRHLSELKSEGSYEDIKRYLAEILQHDYDTGRISEEAYHQAVGRSPGGLPGGLA